MEHIGAGLAALGVFGPGIGIGILAGLSATAIGRNPDAAGQIRGLAIILAAFAEGLGVLAIVVGLLSIFIAFFLLILFDNWIGLVPPVGKVDFLRAPSSDVNITIGMALVSFVIFHTEGIRHLGFGGYFGKFFPVYEFRNGIGAGVIAMFVGLIELMLEFVKPVTLSMRLFGNIYGGEVALGVITTLTASLIPVLLISLELMLNAIQALIFSVLTLVFITLAIEGHEHEEGHIAEEAIDVIDGEGQRLQPAH